MYRVKTEVPFTSTYFRHPTLGPSTATKIELDVYFPTLSPCVSLFSGTLYLVFRNMLPFHVITCDTYCSMSVNCFPIFKHLDSILQCDFYNWFNPSPTDKCWKFSPIFTVSKIKWYTEVSNSLSQPMDSVQFGVCLPRNLSYRLCPTGLASVLGVNAHLGPPHGGAVPRSPCGSSPSFLREVLLDIPSWAVWFTCRSHRPFLVHRLPCAPHSEITFVHMMIGSLCYKQALLSDVLQCILYEKSAWHREGSQ